MAVHAIRDDVAQLHEDLQKLRTDVAHLAHAIRDVGGAKATETRADLEKRLEELKTAVAARYETGLETTRKGVTDHPLTTVAAAFGIGLIAGRLLRR
jgi:ElaB/YqjD/DUF883 family membrane-anchored ribosome-binding protein